MGENKNFDGNIMVVSEKVFITQYNFKKIIPKEFPDGMYKSVSDLIRYTRIKKIFNENELHQFVRLWSIIESPEFLVKHYESLKDQERPEIYSSYHIDKNCIELSKNYLDYTIDSNNKNIRERISTKIRYAFRDYTYSSNSKTLRFNFMENTFSHIDDNGVEHRQGVIPDDLYNEVSKINIQCGNKLGHLFDIVPSSGLFSYENLSLENIELAIDELLDNSDKFRNNDEYIKRKIDSITFAGINKLKNKVGEKEKIWVGSYKEPLFNLIQNYYWIKFNPNLSVERSVIDSLGFKPCQRCASNLNSKA